MCIFQKCIFEELIGPKLVLKKALSPTMLIGNVNNNKHTNEQAIIVYRLTLS